MKKLLGIAVALSLVLAPGTALATGRHQHHRTASNCVRIRGWFPTQWFFFCGPISR